MAAGADYVAVGRISRAHGIRGEVAVLPLSQIESRFAPGARLLAGPEHRPLTVAATRSHRSRLLVIFEEVPDRNAAEVLAGSYLFVPSNEVPAPPEGEFWPHQLVGLRVETDEGMVIGVLAEVVRGTANDLWVARSDEGREVLIPALNEVVREVDLPGGRIVVRSIPGLTIPESEDGGG
jgi:16S rRNA processing protein RimM